MTPLERRLRALERLVDVPHDPELEARLEAARRRMIERLDAITDLGHRDPAAAGAALAERIEAWHRAA